MSDHGATGATRAAHFKQAAFADDDGVAVHRYLAKAVGEADHARQAAGSRRARLEFGITRASVSSASFNAGSWKSSMLALLGLISSMR
jgi:hypothetical protein